MQKMVKYLITSGNSQTGKATIVALKALGESDIVAGARDPAKSEKELKSAGASEVVEFDFTKQDTVEKALKGVERVLIVHSSTNSSNCPKWVEVVVAAAKKESSVKAIGRIAGYVSDVNSPPGAPGRLHGEGFEVLKKSGFQYFSVGPCFFLENWFRNKQSIAGGAVYGAAGDAKVLYVAVDDIGAAAANALKNVEKYNSQHLPIAGDWVSEGDILKAITSQTGQKANYVSLSDPDYEASLLKFGLPAELASLLVSFEKIKRTTGGFPESSKLLREIIGREPLNAKTWAQKYASSFKQ